MLNLGPRSSLIDKITKIYVSRLKPLQNITLGAQIFGDRGETFESHAHFIADKDGEVDVCRDSSLGGSYRGVSAMGLLWSMKPAPGQRKGIRLMKSDLTKPYNIVLNCFDGHVTPNESNLRCSLCQAIRFRSGTWRMEWREFLWEKEESVEHFLFLREMDLSLVSRKF